MRLLLLVLTLPLARGGESRMIEPPPGARLIGTTIVDEIRILPEIDAKSERLPGVEGADRLFQSSRSYSEVVSWFDQQLRSGGYEVMERVERPGSTAWSVKRPDGTLATVAARNTHPTTFEIDEVAAGAAILGK